MERASIRHISDEHTIFFEEFLCYLKDSHRIINMLEDMREHDSIKLFIKF